jgi:hypothetical protein
MSITDRLAEIHEAKQQLRQLLIERGEDVLPVDTWVERVARPGPQELDTERAKKAASEFRCTVFRQEMNLDHNQLLVSGAGEVAELLDVIGDHVRVGILKTGKTLYVPRSCFRPYIRPEPLSAHI